MRAGAVIQPGLSRCPSSVTAPWRRDGVGLGLESVRGRSCRCTPRRRDVRAPLPRPDFGFPPPDQEITLSETRSTSMQRKIIGTARAAVLTAGFVALGVGATFPAGAYADTSGDQSLLGGNQVKVPVTAPINACGNSLALFGKADAFCEGGATAQGGGGADSGRTSGRNSVGGGNQVDAPIKAPVNACGNAVAGFGSAGSDCKGGAKARSGGSGGGGAGRTSGRNSVLGGNQVKAPVTAPVNVCGNSAAVFGDAVSGCKGGAKATGGGTGGGAE